MGNLLICGAGNDGVKKSVDPQVSDRYIIGKKIGEGAFAKVHICKLRSTREQYACKIVDKRRMKAMFRRPSKSNIEKRVKTEIQVSIKMAHPNIIKIFEYFESERYIWIIMELMKGGELFDYIIERGMLTENDAIAIMRQVLHALKFIHEKNIIHRDIKPENLMLKDKHSMNVKVIDFGMSKVFCPGEEATRSRLGTPGYMAPEIMRGQKYTKAVDMWSVGCVTYILLCGYMPFDETYGKSSKYVTDFPDKEWGAISKIAREFISALINADPKARMTSTQALAHPWLSEVPAVSTLSLRTATGALPILSTSPRSNTPLASPRNLKKQRQCFKNQVKTPRAKVMSAPCNISPPPPAPAKE